MTSSVGVRSVGLDRTKLALAVLFLVGGGVAYYALQTQPDYVRYAAVAGGVLIAAILFYFSSYSGRLWTFLLATRNEVRRMVWPSRAETVQVTLLVCAMVIVVSLILWLFDSVLLWILGLITSR